MHRNHWLRSHGTSLAAMPGSSRHWRRLQMKPWPRARVAGCSIRAYCGAKLLRSTPSRLTSKIISAVTHHLATAAAFIERAHPVYNLGLRLSIEKSLSGIGLQFLPFERCVCSDVCFARLSLGGIRQLVILAHESTAVNTISKPACKSRTERAESPLLDRCHLALRCCRSHWSCPVGAWRRTGSSR